MEFLWYSIAGVLSGVLGGMGMGGGTILIPLLTIFYSVNQHSAQATNLISFIPMGGVSLIIHLKNKYVVFKDSLYIILSGIFACFIGYHLAKSLSGDLLSRIFGGFLAILSVFQFITSIKSKA